MLKPFNLRVDSSDAIYWWFCDLDSDSISFIHLNTVSPKGVHTYVLFLSYVSIYSFRDTAFLITLTISPEEYLHCGLPPGNTDFSGMLKTFCCPCIPYLGVLVFFDHESKINSPNFNLSDKFLRTCVERLDRRRRRYFIYTSQPVLTDSCRWG